MKCLCHPEELLLATRDLFPASLRASQDKSFIFGGHCGDLFVHFPCALLRTLRSLSMRSAGISSFIFHALCYKVLPTPCFADAQHVGRQDDMLVHAASQSKALQKQAGLFIATKEIC